MVAALIGRAVAAAGAAAGKKFAKVVGRALKKKKKEPSVSEKRKELHEKAEKELEQHSWRSKKREAKYQREGKKKQADTDTFLKEQRQKEVHHDIEHNKHVERVRKETQSSIDRMTQKPAKPKLRLISNKKPTKGGK